MPNLETGFEYYIPEKEKKEREERILRMGEYQAKITNFIEKKRNRKDFEYYIPEKAKVNGEPYNSEKEAPLFDKTYHLKLENSTSYRDTDKRILNLYKTGFLYDLTSIPEIQEAINNPNLNEKYLQIIKTLSVQSQEEIIKESEQYRKIIETKSKVRTLDALQEFRYQIDNSNSKYNPDTKAEWDSMYPNTAFPTSEYLEEMIDNLKKEMDFENSNLNYGHVSTIAPVEDPLDYEVPDIKTWTNQYSCNLYAASFIESLGMQENFSHRIDSKNRPVIYKIDKQGKTRLYVKENGKLIPPEGQVRELNAEAQLNWVSENGIEYGWEDVTNLSYEQKVKKLSEGYIFFGGNPVHNWIVVGIEIDGKVEPMLTQATTNTHLKPFLPPENINNLKGISEKEKDFYAHTYKLMPIELDTKLFAIKVR